MRKRYAFFVGALLLAVSTAWAARIMKSRAEILECSNLANQIRLSQSTHMTTFGEYITNVDKLIELASVPKSYETSISQRKDNLSDRQKEVIKDLQLNLSAGSYSLLFYCSRQGRATKTTFVVSSERTVEQL